MTNGVVFAEEREGWGGGGTCGVAVDYGGGRAMVVEASSSDGGVKARRPSADDEGLSLCCAVASSVSRAARRRGSLAWHVERRSAVVFARSLARPPPLPSTSMDEARARACSRPSFGCCCSAVVPPCLRLRPSDPCSPARHGEAPRFVLAPALPSPALAPDLLPPSPSHPHI